MALTNEGKKCLQQTRETRVARVACSMALEYGLKDSPCSTERIDVCYKCIRGLSMEPLHRYA